MSKSKKFLFLNTSDTGGAANNLYKMHNALLNNRYQSMLIVKYKYRDDPTILEMPQKNAFHKRIINKLMLTFSRKHKQAYVDTKYHFYNPYNSDNNSDIDFSKLSSLVSYKPDIIIAGWTSMFLKIEQLIEIKKLFGNIPVYWQMTDMSILTGGCHYNWGCDGYTKDCSLCPALNSFPEKSIAKKTLAKKKELISKENIKIISGSSITQKTARASTLFKNQEVIYNVNGLIDITVFNTKLRNRAKEILGIPPASKVIFTGMAYPQDLRKGFDYFINTLIKLSLLLTEEERKSITILLVTNPALVAEKLNQIPFTYRILPPTAEEKYLSIIYQCSDLYLCSSIEDAGPAMVLEAMACGTPVLGFDIGFIHQFVENGKTGFVSSLYDVKSLSKNIKQSLFETAYDPEYIHSIAINNASIDTFIKTYTELD
jgi:glycosyltransferase involved in cell wall biosynthesis